MFINQVTAGCEAYIAARQDGCPLEPQSQIKRGGTLVLHSDSQEETNQDDKSFKKPRLSWKALASPYRNRFITLTFPPYNVKRSLLVSFINQAIFFYIMLSLDHFSFEYLLHSIPVSFTGTHGITVEIKMRINTV